MMYLPIFASQAVDISFINALIERHQLPLELQPIYLEKLNNKFLNSAFDAHQIDRALLLEKGKLALLSKDEQGSLLKVCNDWHLLTRRVVSAGRKSELLLQATKASAGEQIIDGTAGFGHDSLVLAATGASVLMVERQPALALMLLAEKQRMADNKNWHNLLARLNIVCADFCQLEMTGASDVVYLDPMFPKDSYAAKVNKNMQALHGFALPPSLDDEQNLLAYAKKLTANGGRVVIKRPVGAPFLAQQPPVQSWQNDALRFDRY